MIIGSAPSALATEKASDDHVLFTSGTPVGGTARSRSTSAGSSSPGSCEDRRSDVNSAASFVRLPDSVALRLCNYPPAYDVKATSTLAGYDYPAPLCVRNTFIDTDVWRPSSLGDFIQQRQVQSCPASVIGECPGSEDQLEEGFATSWPLHQPVVNNVEIQAETVTAATLVASMEQEVSSAVSESQSSRATSAVEVGGSRLGFVARQAPASLPLPSQEPILGPIPQLPKTPAPIVALSDSPLGPQLGSPWLPTVGSANHQQGVCRPCAFVHTRGCFHGVECTYCHLCGPGGAYAPTGKKKKKKKKWRCKDSAKIQGPPQMQEVLNLFFMNPRKAMRRAAEIAAPDAWWHAASSRAQEV